MVVGETHHFRKPHIRKSSTVRAVQQSLSVGMSQISGHLTWQEEQRHPPFAWTNKFPVVRGGDFQYDCWWFRNPAKHLFSMKPYEKWEIDMVNIPWFAAFYISQVVFSPDFRIINVCLQKLVSLLVDLRSYQRHGWDFQMPGNNRGCFNNLTFPVKTSPWFLLSIVLKLHVYYF